MQPTKREVIETNIAVEITEPEPNIKDEIENIEAVTDDKVQPQSPKFPVWAIILIVLIYIGDIISVVIYIYLEIIFIINNIIFI